MLFFIVQIFCDELLILLYLKNLSSSLSFLKDILTWYRTSRLAIPSTFFPSKNLKGDVLFSGLHSHCGWLFPSVSHCLSLEAFKISL